MKQILRRTACVMLVVVMAMTTVFGTFSTKANAAKVSYKTYINTRFSYTVKYPNVFTKKSDYVSSDGTKLGTSDGSAQATIWNSYGAGKKRNGKTVVATAKKSKKVTVSKATAKECNYYYKSGKNIVQYYYCFLSNGEIAIQLTYPSSKKAYFNSAMKGMIKSVKKNKALKLKD